MKKSFNMRLCFVFVATIAVGILFAVAIASTAFISNSFDAVPANLSNVNIESSLNATAECKSKTFAPIDNLRPSAEDGFATTDTGNYRTISRNAELIFTWREEATYTLSVHFGSASIGSGEDFYTIYKGETLDLTLLGNKSYLINGKRFRSNSITLSVCDGAASFGSEIEIEEIEIETGSEVLLDGLAIADFEKTQTECAYNNSNGEAIAYSTLAHQCEIIMINECNDYVKIMLTFYDSIEAEPDQPGEPDLPIDPEQPSDPDVEIPNTDIQFPADQTPEVNMELTNNHNFVATETGNYRTNDGGGELEFTWRGEATYKFYIFQGDAMIFYGDNDTPIYVAANELMELKLGQNQVIINGVVYNVGKIRIAASGIATLGQEPLASSMEIQTNTKLKLDKYKLPPYVIQRPDYIVDVTDGVITVLSKLEREANIILIDFNDDYVMVSLNFVAPPVVEPDDTEKPPIVPEEPNVPEIPPQVEPPIEDEKPEVPNDDTEPKPPILPQDPDDGDKPSDEGNPGDQQPDEEKPLPPSNEDGNKPPSGDNENTPPNLPDNPDVPDDNNFEPDIIYKDIGDKKVDYVKVVIIVVVASAILLGAAIIIAIVVRRKKKKSAK